MSEIPRPVLSHGEARKRFFIYLLLKIVGLMAMFGGAYLARSTGPAALIGIIVLLAGAASLFVRPRHLGLTTRPER